MDNPEHANSKGPKGACDRCRSQKLKCVGSARPIPNPGCRFQRNETPCERCKRARVECYSVRPASRRAAAGSDRYPHRGSNPPRSSVTGSETVQNGESFNSPQRRSSTRSHNDEQSNRQAEDIHSSNTLPTTSSDWMTYSPVEDMSWNDLSLEPPIWESMLDSLGDHRMSDPTTRTTSVDWSLDQPDMEVDSGQTGSTHPGSSAQGRPGPAQRSAHQLAQSLETTQSCIQELTRLNEILLREKNTLENASTSRGRLSIGQILHHCQEFLSILRRLRWSSPNKSDDNASQAESEWTFPGDVTENSGSSSFSSSSRSSRTSLTPAVPPLEIPTLLSILSCYAYILQAYDSLLTPILDNVTRSAPTVPATLDGLRLDGFELDGHHTLQLECWTSVSYNMLERMEYILIGTPRRGGIFSQAGGGLLRDKLSAGLLDTLYDQNEQNALPRGDGNCKREVRAKRLIREIQAELKVVDLQ